MKVKLRDFVELVKTRVDIKDADVANYISTDNMLPNRGGVEFGNSKLPTTKTVNNFIKGDVLISNIRPYFKKIWFADRSGTRSSDVLCFRATNEKLSKEYLYCVLQSDSFFNYVMSTSKGTKMPRGDKEAILDYEFELVSKEKQYDKYHSILLLERKIYLNNRINDNLLGQLKVISDNYFSYFTFNKGIVPDDWEYKKLTDVAEITTGYSYTGKELVDSNIGMATIKNFTRNGGFRSEGYKPIVPSKNVKKDKYVSLFDMLVAHTDLTQNADIIGNAEPVLTTNSYEKTIYSMDLVKVVPKQDKISKWLLDLVLMSSRVKFHCLSYVNGTTVLHLSKKALREFEIPLPKDYKELENIIDLTKNYLTTVSKNIQENSKLNEIKNQLLNKYF